MKKLMKSMVLMAAAAVALVSCAKENISEQNNGGQKFAEVSFKAEIPAYRTTKSTIDVDGLTFNTRWSEGDQMGMSYSYGETGSKKEEENVPAKYSKDGSYTVSLPPEYSGKWEYYVYYPYQSTITSSNSVEIPFGAERTQTGNVINPVYDIMHALHGANNAAAGKEEDGSSIHFEMERLTSLLYFHFTSSIKEKVLKATLSVDGDPIAADKYVMHVDMTNATTSYTTGQTYDEITINLTGATADDFSLWFNILPYEKSTRENGIENIKLVVETETKTFSITNPNTELDIYEAGQIHSITANVPDNAWKDKTTPTPPATKVYYEKVTTAQTDWSGDYLIVYETGSVAFDGSLTTFDGSNNYQEVNISNGQIEATNKTDAISFEISSTDGGYYIRSSSGYYIGRETNSNGVDCNTATKYLNTISDTGIITGKGGAALQVYAASGKNPQMNFKYYKSSQKSIALYKRSENIDRPTVPSLTLSDGAATVAADAVTTSFDVTSNLGWTVSTAAEWITDWTKSGSNDGTVTIKFEANTASENRTATFTVESTDKTISKTFTLTQKAAGATTTVTDVLTADDFAATYSETDKKIEYKDFNNVKKTSNAIYSGNSAKSSTGAIQLRSKNSNSGIVTTASGGTAKSVKITVASGTGNIDIYGSNTAYTAASDLYATSGNITQGTKIGSLSKTGTITIDGSYKYIGIRSNKSAVYISSIEIVWE